MLHLATGTITSARVAPHTGEVFVGFDTGQIMAFRASNNRLVAVGQCRGPVSTLATTLGGELVVAECSSGGEVLLQSFTRIGDGPFQSAGLRTLQGLARPAWPH